MRYIWFLIEDKPKDDIFFNNYSKESAYEPRNYFKSKNVPKRIVVVIIQSNFNHNKFSDNKKYVFKTLFCSTDNMRL